MQITLKQRILRYFKNNPERLIPSGEIQRLVTEKTHYTPANASRRLRELAQEGLLDVTQIKNHAHYRLRDNTALEEILHAMNLYFESL